VLKYNVGRPGRRAVLVVLASVGLSGVGIAAWSAAQPSAESPKGVPITRPPIEAGMSNEERELYYKSLESRFQERYAEWLRGTAVSAADLRSMQRRPLLATYAGPPASFDELAASTDLAVLGEVIAVRFEPSTAIMTVRVENAWVGQPSATIEISVGGGLMPNEDFSGGFIAEDESAPLLLPGDRAVFMLHGIDTGDRFNVIPFAGEYRIVDGKTVGLPLNPVPQLQGLHESDVVGQLSARFGAATTPL
jgi:hypothetical protein